jgi:CheY-like chemotaxis protein
MSQSVLVGEDNLYTIEQYNKILSKNGCKVTIAKDGDECVQKYNEALKNAEFEKTNPFDVVVIDNNMPKKSGVLAAQEILEKRPQQRIIFASAYDLASIANVSDTIKESVEILQKPFTLNSLLAKIQNK